MTRKETTMKNAGTVINLDIKKMCVLKNNVTWHTMQKKSQRIIMGVNRPKIVQDENNENNGHDDTWIGDTGATWHMTNSTIRLWDVCPCKGIVDAATGTKTMVTRVGTIKGKVLY